MITKVVVKDNLLATHTGIIDAIQLLKHVKNYGSIVIDTVLRQKRKEVIR